LSSTIKQLLIVAIYITGHCWLLLKNTLPYMVILLMLHCFLHQKIVTYYYLLSAKWIFSKSSI